VLKEMKNRNSTNGQSHSDGKSGCRTSVPTIEREHFDTCVHLLDVRGQLGQGLTVGQDGAGGTAQEGVVPHTEETRQDLTTGQTGEASRRTRATGLDQANCLPAERVSSKCPNIASQCSVTA
jgi:hypothetical protein